VEATCENEVSCDGNSCWSDNLFLNLDSFFISFALLCFNMKANALSINCEYSKEYGLITIHEQDQIICDVKNANITEPNVHVTQALVNHAGGNDKIRGWKVFSQTMNFIPSGMDNVFTNLKCLWFEKCDLLRVFQSDFRPFTELRGLHLRSNDRLSVLERDLFKHNKKLYYLNLYNNGFLHIDPNTFGCLSCLTSIEFSASTCISVYFANEPMDILKQKFIDDCQDEELYQEHQEFKRKNRIYDE